MGQKKKRKKCLLPTCAKKIKRRGTKVKFCSLNCHIKYKALTNSHPGAFKPKQKPINYVRKGKVVIRRDKTHTIDGKRILRNYIKISKGKFYRYDKYIWEKHNNIKLKVAYNINHKDGNLLNDDICNLQPITSRGNVLKIIVCKNEECKSLFFQSIKRKNFCSHNCFIESKKNVIKKTIKCENKKCDICFAPTIHRRRFCSIKCYNDSIRTLPKICEFVLCKKNFIPKEKKNIFCSTSCSINSRKNYNGKIKLGVFQKNSLYPRRLIFNEMLNKWFLYSDFLWQKNKGAIPEGFKVGFKDEDSFNDQDIENLILIPNKQLN